ncbi:hypothetical protein Rsub_08267 [Raphidocelis subcapitata]|uniref:Uncharacterized protein n=1 Tax=Raphidocelis subcapitata TaxID=307507 RepID=A0A2V0P7I6_9CHLO|nr:hypothetical protein Rsub_08267 [Raphidocelis subcapitata]|eukprot:GBF95831.1 hypothetical protein Rsub_08267 [Raphidocelis subcapitata]
MALQLAPEALCQVAPAARTLCLAAWIGGLTGQAAEALPQLSPLPAFAGWPADAVVEVMKEAAPLAAFSAVVAWMEAQPRPVKHQHVWPRLLYAVAWSKASRANLSGIRRHKGAAKVPGLQGFWTPTKTFVRALIPAMPKLT